MLLMSSCCADLNVLSFITKFYDSNVQSLRNFFNFNEEVSDASAFTSDNEINGNEIDNRYWMNYLRKDDLYGVRQPH